jgi:hypothetical protein
MSEEQDIKVEDDLLDQDFLNMSDEELDAVDINSLGKPIKEDTSEDDQEDTLGVNTPNSTEESNESIEIDYKAEYERITAPFKANGKEVQVNSIDDAIQLMQMGADYQRKTTEIKPLRKIGEKLKQNGLLDEEQLNYLIDLKNKNPQAIQKLLKESGIDPLDIDTSEEVNYKPNNYQVDEKVIELNDVLDSIQHTPQFDTTVKILGSQWDQQSKEYLSSNPQTISILNEHIGNGIYDTIANEVSKQRMLGRLNNVSDLDAYRTVGDYIQATGGFATAKQEVVTQQAVQQPKPVQDNKQKKQAASITNSKPSTPKKDLNNVDWFNLSDAEFAAMEKQLLKQV